MVKPSKLISGIVISSVLLIGSHAYGAGASTYTVKSGDTLWKISQNHGVSVSQIKSLNSLKSDLIYPGQQLKLSTYSAPASGTTIKHTVRSGDTLWKISVAYGTTVSAVKQANNLSSDMIYPGQVFTIPSKTSATAQTAQAVYAWPDVVYIVQAGDNVETISKKFGVSASNILKYNYRTSSDWFFTGEKIAISGYAPRTYTVSPGESNVSTSTGKLVDWFLEGKYIIKHDEVFVIRDYVTGKQFKVKSLGGSNHCDVEPLTANDTAVMKQIFSKGWGEWTPRPVVIFKDGMNIAASLSGMPHSVDSISGNGVTGHFDMYLYNSKPHSGDTSATYVEQHRQTVLKATGK